MSIWIIPVAVLAIASGYISVCGIVAAVSDLARFQDWEWRVLIGTICVFILSFTSVLDIAGVRL